MSFHRRYTILRIVILLLCSTMIVLSYDAVTPSSAVVYNPALATKSRTRKKLEVNVRSTLECHRREYTYKAVNKDKATGHKCWAYLTVESCWGRCDSGEIADYHFPFKKSYHYVCIHDNTELIQYKLGECTVGAPDALRLYETVVAKSCVCALCETSSANCESYPAK